MTSILELINKYKSLEDKIAAILYTTGLDRIPTDLRILHTAFYEISKDHNEFFNDLHFKIGGRFPYSESLDQVFPALAISGLISCENPEYDVYTINLQQKKLIEKNILPLFSSETETDDIKKIAEELKQKIIQC